MTDINKMIQEVIERLQCTDMLSLMVLSTRVWFDSFPFLPRLQCQDWQEALAMTGYMRSIDDNVPLSRPLIFKVRIMSTPQIRKRVIAQYFRCMNERCRAVELTQCLAPRRCEQCREEMTDLPLLAVKEEVVEVVGRMDDWRRDMTLILPGHMGGIHKGEEYWMIGFPEMKMAMKSSFHIIVVGAQQAIYTPQNQVMCHKHHFGLVRLLSSIIFPMDQSLTFG